MVLHIVSAGELGRERFRSPKKNEKKTRGSKIATYGACHGDRPAAARYGDSADDEIALDDDRIRADADRRRAGVAG